MSVYKGMRMSLLVLLWLETVGAYFSNHTLRSVDGDLSVVLYLPLGVQQDDGNDIFYRSTRFDHSSMIGTITRKTRDEDGVERTHVLYGVHQWVRSF